MSIEVLEPERGDDRNPDISVERLEEMFNQPEAPEPERVYVSDTPGVAIGEIALRPLRMDKYPRQLGNVAFRKAFIRPTS